MKTAFKKLFPDLFIALKNLSGNLYIDEINELIVRECAGAVVAGPFAGMRYIAEANSSALAPKLLGTYEKELHETMRAVISRPYDLVLDVGCAEGYYAVGLALRMPSVTVNAYDIDPAALRNLQTLTALNNVSDRVINSGLCSPGEFDRHGNLRCLVICDIEGAERDLLDPAAASALRGFDIVVEIHDGPERTDIHDLLQQRFAPTHRLSFVPYEERTAADGAQIKSLSRAKSRQLAVEEFRTYGIEWGVFEAMEPSGKHDGNPTGGQR
jgi:predicted RNA methylase